MTLYLKYRPQNIEELDLVEVREMFKKALGSGHIPHAWLFSGPRGTGKTSSARILAKYINCTGAGQKPCNECEMCKSISEGAAADIVEMDAASNRGIDEVRELRERVGLTPMKAKYKVYIIDEAHMLTTEAANALLKTLEEPPAHVVFVLCTTEADKLPETVVSRCMRVQFKKPSKKEIEDKLKLIIKAEKYKIKDEDVVRIAKAGRGSFRDAIKILEQVVIGGGETDAVLGSVGAGDPEEFLAAVRAGEAETALKIIGKLVDQGADLRSWVELCVESLREELLTTRNKSLIGLIEGLEKAYGRMRDAAVVQLPLEIFVIENSGSKIPEVKSSPSATKPVVEKTEPIEALKEPSGKYKLDDMNAKWQEVMKAVRPKNHSVEALLRSTRPVGFDGRDLVLEAFYEFHKKQLETEKCRQIVESAVGEVFGVDAVVLRLRMGEAAKKNVEPNVAKVDDDELLKAAQEIFK